MEFFFLNTWKQQWHFLAIHTEQQSRQDWKREHLYQAHISTINIWLEPEAKYTHLQVH